MSDAAIAGPATRPSPTATTAATAASRPTRRRPGPSGFATTTVGGVAGGPQPVGRPVLRIELGVLAEHRAVVVSTHDVNDLATSFDRVVVLAEGHVKFDGSAADFLRGAGTAGRPVDAYRSVLSDHGAP